jgi:hypothetical protein
MRDNGYVMDERSPVQAQENEKDTDEEVDEDGSPLSFSQSPRGSGR